MKKKIIYLEILRIIACVLVLINHTNGVILNNPTFSNTLFYCMGFSICKIGVALFFMITGVLLLNKKYDYKKSFKSIYRVLIPLLGLSLILYVKDIGFSNFNIVLFLKQFLSKPIIIPYWYIYALIGLYLVIPFIEKLIKNFENKDYIIFIIYFLLGPALINLISIYFNVNFYKNIFASYFSTIIAIVISGNYISKLKIDKKYFITSIIIFVISYIGMFCSIFLPYLLNNGISYELDNWDTLPILLMATSIFYIIKYLFENKKISLNAEKIITVIGSTTFGIYLIHALINYKVYNMEIIKKVFAFNDIIGTILLDVILFIICFIIIYILKKIPFIKKIL